MPSGFFGSLFGKKPPSEVTPGLDSTPIPENLDVPVNTRFAVDLLQGVAGADLAGNLTLSPAGVAYSVALLHAGAMAETRRGIAQALSGNPDDTSDVGNAVLVMKQLVAKPTDRFRITVANSLWVQQDLEIHPAFQRANVGNQHMATANVDFSDPLTHDLLSDWIMESTEGRIAEMEHDFGPDTLFTLVNAVHCFGQWLLPFEFSGARPFLTGSGETIAHRAISLKYIYPHLLTPEAEIVAVPYADSRFQVYFLLPREGESLGAFIRSLTPERWEWWLRRMKPRKGTLTLPAFEVNSETPLSAVLGRMGMAAAFNPVRANFGNLIRQDAAERRAHMTELVHRASLEISAEGSTLPPTVIGRTQSAQPRDMSLPPFDMQVDRPFLLAIREGGTGAVLALSAVFDPRG